MEPQWVTINITVPKVWRNQGFTPEPSNVIPLIVLALMRAWNDAGNNEVGIEYEVV